MFFFFKNHAQIEVARLVPGLFLFFKKMLYEVTAKDLRLSFGIFWWSSKCYKIKKKLYKTYWSRDTLKCYFQKGLKISTTFFVDISFFKNIFCFSYYILLTDQVALLDYLYFLRYWSINVLLLFANQVASNVINLT